jgi:molybdate transport system ATP-binding protein
MNPKPLIEIKNLSLTIGQTSIFNNLNFNIEPRQSIAVVGPSGCGKTMLGKMIGGHISPSSGEIKFNLPSYSKRIFISQQHDFRENTSRSYYQQRFDSNYGSDSPTVKDELLKSITRQDKSTNNDFKFIEEITKKLSIHHLLDKRLIELSNGEGKRLQLARALLNQPQVIVLDNPFIGLDKEARSLLRQIVQELINSSILIIIITSVNELTDLFTHVLQLNHSGLWSYSTLSEFNNQTKNQNTITSVTTDHNDLIIELTSYGMQAEFKVAVEMKQVSISYGNSKILENINWKINKGERWALLGSNGAGKSTLLSLINGDNPQAYSNDIWLFDRKKGSGESIWEIKSKIGYISPELHIYYQRNQSYTETLTLNASLGNSSFSSPGTTVFEAIASGFNDQIGSSQQITSLQTKKIHQWMGVLNVYEYKNQNLANLSLGIQRLVLLARALVKNPPMLILDEPCQGLDMEQTKRFTQTIDQICYHSDKTLIYVSHYKEDIPLCVTQFLELEKGKVKNTGSL